MREPLMLTFNAGSSTVKIGLFSLLGGSARSLGKGVLDLRRRALVLRLTQGAETHEIALSGELSNDFQELLQEVFGCLANRFGTTDLLGIGHRIVHGGDVFSAPVKIDDAVMASMEALIPLAPLHQPHALRIVRAIRSLRPELAQSASFDTAFHSTNADIIRRFALPRALHEAGIKRYGFHGISYQYVASELRRLAPDVAGGKVVVAHLGSGASLCAIEAGISRDTSMSFSTLDGVPMATRCGALDPGVILHLLGQKGQSREEIEDLLYHRSGLLGVSGISADTRDLLESERSEAGEAIDLFALRIAGETARLASTLGGLDAIVFTAGIGEHQPAVRAAIAARLGWLGLRLDSAANAANSVVLSSSESQVTAFVIGTNEEQIIVEDAVSALCLR